MNQIIEHETGMDMIQSDNPTIVAELTRAEIDMQIATAHKFKRSLTHIVRNITTLATMSRESAEACMYALPRGGKPITGPSIRLAEIVAMEWGNCRYGARVVHVDKQGGFIEAEGIFHDLEKNAAATKRVRRRITDKRGKVFSDDMIMVTGNAACSIALRNAIFTVVPEAVWGEAYKKALQTMKGDAKTMPERIEAAMKATAAFGMTPEQVWQVLGIGGEKDCTIDHLMTLGGIVNALKEEQTTVEALLAETGGVESQDRRKGSITNRDTKQKPDPKPEPEPDAKDSDPVVEDDAPDEDAGPSEDDKAKMEAAMAADQKWRPVYETILSDLNDASVEEVMDLYGKQIADMKTEAPDLHKELESEIEAFRNKS